MELKGFGGSVGVKSIEIEVDTKPDQGEPTDLETAISNVATQDQEEPADFETAISKTGYGRFNYLLLLGAIPASCSSVFNTTSVAFILPLAGCDLSLTNFDKGLLNGGIYMGMISSAFLWGFLSDKLGRRNLLVVGYFLDAISGILTSIAPTFWLILFFKFISGFIISGPFAVMISYLAEFHSAQYRARVIMFTSVYVSLAQTLVPVLALVFIPQTWYLNLWDGILIFNPWRCFVFLCALPSLLASISIYFFDESPKFLMTSGRNEEALKVFRNIYHINTGNLPETFPIKVLLDERKLRKTSISSKPAHGIFKTPLYIFKIFWKQTKPLLESPHLSKAMLLFSIQFGSMLAMNTVRLWLPQLFATMQEFTYSSDPDKSVSLCEMLEVNDEKQSNSSEVLTESCSLGAMDIQTYLNSVIVACTAGICYLLASYLINLTGKKNLMIVASGIAGICGICIYWSRNVDLTLALMALFLGFGGISVSAILSVVVDIFPTNLRTMAVSLTMMCGRTGSLLGNLMFPILLDLSCQLPFLLVSGMTLCSCFLSFFLPVTLMKALE